MSNHRNVTVFSIIVILHVNLFAWVMGRVVDGAGNPVFDAMVNYTNMDNRLIYVYTNESGYFKIPSPTEWNLDSLPMYISMTTAIEHPVNEHSFNHSATNFSTQQRGSLIHFTVRAGDRRIAASLYTVAGKKVCTLFNKKMEPGRYAFNPLPKGVRAFSSQVYIVHMSDGIHRESLRLLPVGLGGSGMLSRISDASSNGLPTIRAVAAIDGVRAGKTGYRASVKDIDAYSDNVGDIEITAIDIEKKVDSLLAMMTGDEKIGQLVQSFNGSNITSHFVGSTLKGSTWEWMQGVQNQALSTRMKIPLTVGNDYVHGGPKIYFPHNIGLGAMNNPLLVELAYRIIAMCCKVGNNVNFAPCVDIPRDDKYGRVYEGWSEDVEDTKTMTRATVRGTQGTDLSSDYTMIASIKHYAAAGGTWDGIMRGEARTGSWDVLCKIHLPQFRTAVDEGVASIMTAYNSFLTSPTDNTQLSCTEHKILINDTLKNGWKFDGFVISDWCQVYQTQWNPPINRIAGSYNAGLDVAMQPNLTTEMISELKNLVPGTIPQSRVDDAVKRHLRVKLRMGLFENVMSKKELADYLESDEYREVARACVRQSLVLLKNSNNVLPLRKDTKIHVVGVWADNMGYQCGGWTESGGDAWQGSNIPHGIPGATTIKEALTAAIGSGGRVTYAENASNIPSDAEVIVVAVGETNYAEDAGYRTDIALPAAHQTLVATCAASSKLVVTILIIGRPNVLGTIPDNSTALVAAWLPGTEGTGIADVLFGDYNFTGTLKFTWPATNAQEPINAGNMGDRVGSGGNPLYPYGTGLRMNLAKKR